MAPQHLSKRVVLALGSEDNQLWLSAISIWEVLILIERKRITVRQDAHKWVDEALSVAPIREAPVTFAIARESRAIHLPHQDPADRFIAATANALDLTLITADQQLIDAKGLKVLANV
jgi:PIN domain nuclease of toxin-antitoxin system